MYGKKAWFIDAIDVQCVVRTAVGGFWFQFVANITRPVVTKLGLTQSGVGDVDKFCLLSAIGSDACFQGHPAHAVDRK